MNLSARSYQEIMFMIYCVIFQVFLLQGVPVLRITWLTCKAADVYKPSGLVLMLQAATMGLLDQVLHYTLRIHKC